MVKYFLSVNDNLQKHQYAFREKHSTIHPIIHSLSHYPLANNIPKQVTLSIFCDLLKAYDIIETDTLLSKLNYYGIRGITESMVCQLSCQ